MTVFEKCRKHSPKVFNTWNYCSAVQDPNLKPYLCVFMVNRVCHTKSPTFWFSMFIYTWQRTFVSPKYQSNSRGALHDVYKQEEQSYGTFGVTYSISSPGQRTWIAWGTFGWQNCEVNVGLLAEQGTNLIYPDTIKTILMSGSTHQDLC